MTSAGSTPRRGDGRTLGDQVTGAIIDLIGQGRILPGERLVEASIARMLGVGTVPVREALRMLAGDGIVELRPNRGAILRTLSIKELVDTLKALTGLLVVALDAIEPSDLAPLVPELEVVVARMANAAADGNKRGLFRCGEMFQRALLVAADNQYILRSVDRVHFEFYNSVLITYVPAEALAGLVEPYREILVAIASGDMVAVKTLYGRNAAQLQTILAERMSRS